MPDQSKTELISFQNWTLRVRPAKIPPARLLLLLHGLTGDENSLWIFVRNLPENFWVVAPRAPFISSKSIGGYSWRLLKSEDEGWPDLDDLQQEVEPLISLIDAYSIENNIDASKFDVFGFSQGGAMVNLIALTHPERINRAGILASFFPANAESLIHHRPLNGIKFFVAHGRLDETVKIEYARQSVKMLEMAGADVTFCEDNVGHKVSARCMRALEEFFT